VKLAAPKIPRHFCAVTQQESLYRVNQRFELQMDRNLNKRFPRSVSRSNGQITMFYAVPKILNALRNLMEKWLGQASVKHRYERVEVG